MKHILLIALLISSAFLQAQVANTYETAQQAYENFEVEEAYIHLKNALQEDPDHLPSKILMGKVLFKKGFARDAIIEFEDSVSAGADINLFISDFASAYLYLGLSDEIADLPESGLTSANLLNLLLVKATSAFSIGDDLNAEKIYKKAQSLYPNNQRVLQSLVYHYLFVNKIDDAKTSLKSLVALAPDDYRTIHLQGILAKRDKNYDEAETLLIRARALSNDDPIVLRTLADVYLENQNIENAKDIIDVIVKNTPNDPFALLLLARINENLSGVVSSELLAEVNQQLSLVPEQIKLERAELIFAQALATYMGGNYEQAAIGFESYRIKNRSDVNAISLLADTYIKLDQDFKALALLDGTQGLFNNNLELNLMLCNLYLESNKTFKCSLLLDKLSDKLGNTNPSIVYARTRTLHARGKSSEALALFEEYFANQLDPNVIFFHVELLRAELRNEEALTRIEQLLRILPDSLDAQITKSELLVILQRYEEAAELLKLVLAKDSNNSLALHNSAIVNLQLGMLDSAEADIKKAIALDTESSSSIFQSLLAKIYLAQNKLNDAQEVLEEAKLEHGSSRYLSDALIDLYKRQGNNKAAIRELDILLKQYFLNEAYLVEKTRLLIQEEEYDKAKQQAKLLFGIWGEKPEQLIFLASLQTNARDYAGALQSLDSFDTLSGVSARSQLQRTQTLIQANRIADAQSTANNLAKLAPMSPVAKVVIAEAFLMTNEYAKSFSLYKEALDISPEYNLAIVKMYQLVISQDKFVDEFVNVAKKLIAGSPNNSLIKNMLADLYMTKKSYSQALELYLSITADQRYRNLALVHNNIANIYLNSIEDITKAEFHVDAALALNKQHPLILDTHGWLKAKQENFDGALTILRQAITLDSDNPQIQYHLAYVLAQLGRNDEAVRLLEDAISNSSRYFDSKLAQSLLQKIKA
ncbi:tetratricopeptide repeat protein [Glaciecola sp. MH2013]|uniref:tetratricopeptide repeat protein n=1 Tax=Glaciecola sp. MH2013 TaxID=2785524 RepID=UPI00189CABB4|nr:tetratricopeptide repeat protein [Glaciecola sp. MH2013]MBF7074688.1 tetratricopeptide repeat protein [Glaciecola sp. MH2013]